MALAITMVSNLTGCAVMQTTPQTSGSVKIEVVESTEVQETQQPTENHLDLTQIDAEITEEQAKSIAYQHAGIRAEEVQYCRVDADWKQGSLMYEIDFTANDMEYEYEVNSDGVVMQWNIEPAGESFRG